MILDQLIDQPMQGNAHEAINNIISQISRATQAWFPQGQFLGMNVPQYTGDVINAILTLGAGRPAYKGAKILADEGKRAIARHGMKGYIPKSGTVPGKLPPIAAKEKMINQLLDEMHSKNTMWNKHFDRAGGLTKPLKGKYQQIPQLRKEVEGLKLQEEKDRWMELINRIPRLDHLK